MKPVIKISITIFFLSFLLTGCSKNKESFQSYLKGKMDDVPFECTNIKANTMPRSGGDPAIIITGEWPMYYSIKLNIYEGAGITTGTYAFQGFNRATILQYGAIEYFAGDGVFSVSPQLHGSGQLTILEISTNYIKSSFEFVTDINPFSGVLKTVTDGEFYIKRE
jgi:hypothetical protein